MGLEKYIKQKLFQCSLGISCVYVERYFCFRTFWRHLFGGHARKQAPKYLCCIKYHKVCHISPTMCWLIVWFHLKNWLWSRDICEWGQIWLSCTAIDQFGSFSTFCHSHLVTTFAPAPQGKHCFWHTLSRTSDHYQLNADASFQR